MMLYRLSRERFLSTSWPSSVLEHKATGDGMYPRQQRHGLRRFWSRQTTPRPTIRHHGTGRWLCGRGWYAVGMLRDWIRTLISPLLLDRWVNRSYGETTFRFTQLLTGHGCFNQYLNRIDRAPAFCRSPDSYSEEDDDAFYTLSCCKAFEHAKDELSLVIGLFLLRDLVARMLKSSINWDAGIQFVETVMRSKKNSQRER